MDHKKEIAGYEILETVGEGGMGVVYRAYDSTLDRTLAIKLIRESSLGPEGRERFLREARACSRINHPNIITVYTAGEDRGRPYIAMEFLQGRTLREMLAAQGSFPWDRAARWMVDLLDALSRLHAEGIIHRDIKPDNIMLTEEGLIKLMDFGIARIASSATLTQEGAALGTVYYMSPEQVQGERVDERTDVFSIGCLLYQLVTGELPFPGEEPLSVMYRIQNEDPKPLAEYRLNLPEGFIEIIQKALAKDKSQRFKDAASFKADLKRLLEEEGYLTSELESARKKMRLMMRLVVPAVTLILAALVVYFVALRPGPSRNRALAVQHNELAQGYEKEGKLDLAEEEYHKAIIADVDYAVPWNNLGVIAFGRGDLAEADSLFGEAIKRDSSYVPAIFNRGTSRWDMEDFQAAERLYAGAIRIDSSFYQAYNNYGALLLTLDRPVEARRILAKGLEIKHDHFYLLKNMGTACLRTGEDSLALEYYRDAYDVLPENEEINKLLASWYEEHARYDQALLHWRKVASSKDGSYRKEAQRALKRISNAKGS